MFLPGILDKEWRPCQSNSSQWDTLHMMKQPPVMYKCQEGSPSTQKKTSIWHIPQAGTPDTMMHSTGSTDQEDIGCNSAPCIRKMSLHYTLGMCFPQGLKIFPVDRKCTSKNSPQKKSQQHTKHMCSAPHVMSTGHQYIECRLLPAAKKMFQVDT